MGFLFYQMQLFLCINVQIYYNKKEERSIIYNDPDLGIEWQVDNPVVSEKDLKAKFFKDIQPDFVFQ